MATGRHNKLPRRLCFAEAVRRHGSSVFDGEKDRRDGFPSGTRKRRTEDFHFRAASAAAARDRLADVMARSARSPNFLGKRSGRFPLGN